MDYLSPDSYAVPDVGAQLQPRGSTDGSRSRPQECEPAHVIAQVAQPSPSGCALLPDAPHPRPFHLVNHAAEHMFDATRTK